jgi:hypothetical protein
LGARGFGEGVFDTVAGASAHASAGAGLDFDDLDFAVKEVLHFSAFAVCSFWFWARRVRAASVTAQRRRSALVAR